MSIRVRHGEIADIAKLGVLAGQAKAAQKEAEYAQRMTMQLQQMQHQKEMAQFQAQLQLDRMKYSATMDFQGEQRAREWELEKMEIRSRLDFEREEKERIRKLDAADNALQQLEKEVKSGRLDKNNKQYQNLRFYYEMEKIGAVPPISLIQPPTEKERYISPTQQLAAYKALQTEELEEPGWWDKFLQATTFGVLGKEPLTEEEKVYREQFGRIARGQPSIPTGTISQGLPEPKTQLEYNRIPSGSQYIDSSGNVRTKS